MWRTTNTARAWTRFEQPSRARAGAKPASFAFTPPPPAPFEDGKQFDVHWEIRTESRSTVLRSGCITVTVR